MKNVSRIKYVLVLVLFSGVLLRLKFLREVSVTSTNPLDLNYYDVILGL